MLIMNGLYGHPCMVDDKVEKTGVINDPSGQLSNSANSN